jgi:phage host-nuclease inhibitor protein Gam
MGREFSHIARRCERAVVTAYRELRDGGNADLAAFTACTTLYRIHHPESSVTEARRLVAEWIDHHVVQGMQTEAPGCDCN